MTADPVYRGRWGLLQSNDDGYWQSTGTLGWDNRADAEAEADRLNARHPNHQFHVHDRLPPGACHACGFIGTEDPFTAAWHRAHNAHHIDTFPDLDQITIDNLQRSLDRAEKAESES